MAIDDHSSVDLQDKLHKYQGGEIIELSKPNRLPQLVKIDKIRIPDIRMSSKDFEKIGVGSDVPEESVPHSEERSSNLSNLLIPCSDLNPRPAAGGTPQLWGGQGDQQWGGRGENQRGGWGGDQCTFGQ